MTFLTDCTITIDGFNIHVRGGDQMKTELFIEFNGKQIAESDIMNEAKKSWKDAGNKAGDIHSCKLYMKPEENMTYFVINDSYTGNFSL